MPIVLDAPHVIGSRLTVRVRAGEARKFLKSGIFWADYGDLDISNVDPALLVLPALGSVLPVAYASGIPVVVDSVDRDFAESAAELAPIWSEMYPRFAAGSRFSLVGARVTTSRPAGSGGSLLLYSGGVDSTASLLANQADVRATLPVWGADVPLENESLWQALSALIATGPLTKGVRRVGVRTNTRNFAKQFRVIHDFLGPDGDWWGWVQHGLALLSLAAPASAALGLDQVIIASSHTTAFSQPWGSSPLTDNKVRWRGTAVRHDLFALSRQQKIARYLAPYLSSGGQLDLAVCHQPSRGFEGVNCGRCEKCLRTASGLLAAGADPVDAGLQIAPGMYSTWQNDLISGRQTLDDNALFHWRVIQEGIPTRLDYPSAEIEHYLSWLRNLDLEELSMHTTQRQPSTVELRFQLRRVADLLPESSLQALRRVKSNRVHKGYRHAHTSRQANRV